MSNSDSERIEQPDGPPPLPTAPPSPPLIPGQPLSPMPPKKDHEGTRRDIAIGLLVLGGLGGLGYFLLSSYEQQTDRLWSNIAAWGFILGGGYFAFLAFLWAVKQVAMAAAEGKAEGTRRGDQHKK